jgi:type II protein arginine methyltransferase
MDKLNKNMYEKLTFISKNNSILHGFAGFFETQLYGKVWLSINPNTHTKDMRSWFPMYFPINKPISVEKGSLVSISMWRLTKSTRVWYEWALSIEPEGSSESSYESDIHNVNGEHYWIGSTI